MRSLRLVTVCEATFVKDWHENQEVMSVSAFQLPWRWKTDEAGVPEDAEGRRRMFDAYS